MTAKAVKRSPHPFPHPITFPWLFNVYPAAPHHPHHTQHHPHTLCQVSPRPHNMLPLTVMQLLANNMFTTHMPNTTLNTTQAATRVGWVQRWHGCAVVSVVAHGARVVMRTVCHEASWELCQGTSLGKLDRW